MPLVNNTVLQMFFFYLELSDTIYLLYIYDGLNKISKGFSKKSIPIGSFRWLARPDRVHEWIIFPSTQCQGKQALVLYAEFRFWIHTKKRSKPQKLNRLHLKKNANYFRLVYHMVNRWNKAV